MAVTLTFLSNGHGEDAVGVLLAEELLRQRPGLKLAAFPTVDEGHAYERLDLPLLGPCQKMPSGGLLFHSRALFFQDVRAGFFSMTLAQLRDLRRLRTDALVVVGDIYALLLSSLVKTRRRFFVQTLVSSYHTPERDERKRLNRYFMERISLPERVLMRHLVERVYVRDKSTERALHDLGLEHAVSLGNPMLDAVTGTAMPQHSEDELILALLPGTRRYSSKALRTMLQALTHLPSATALVAWAGGALPDLSPFESCECASYEGLRAALAYKEQRVFIYEGRFADILQSADVVLGTAGTANEQAAALGLPVVSFPVPPDYSDTFLRNQKRLLADALTLTSPEPEAIAVTVQTLMSDPSSRARTARAGRERMGTPGGTKVIVQDILGQLEP